MTHPILGFMAQVVTIRRDPYRVIVVAAEAKEGPDEALWWIRERMQMITELVPAFATSDFLYWAYAPEAHDANVVDLKRQAMFLLVVPVVTKEDGELLYEFTVRPMLGPELPPQPSPPRSICAEPVLQLVR
ncbi:hypothetical protein ACIBCO_09930 [Streptomyces violascens]|uniref:hypothetical protein n=1 Tax=Streptomyces violascens TaxID=67381 RepID=UPI0037A28A10